jgi:hypothetical protein
MSTSREGAQDPANAVVVAIAKWTSPTCVEWITQPESFAVVAAFCDDPEARHVWRFEGATKSEVTLAVYAHGIERFGVGPRVGVARPPATPLPARP